MAISSIGVGSGLPLEELLNDIRKSENLPLQLIKQRQDLSEARLSAYGHIKNSISELQKSAQALANSEKYGALKATSSNEALGVKVDHDAIAGNYTIKVDQLATHQSLAAAGQASREDTIGSGGQISFTIGDDTKTIDLGSDTSLQGIMKTINADAELGVQATILNDGSDKPYRLVLTAKDTGTEAAVSNIEVTGNTQLADVLNYDADSNTSNYQETKAQNAEININGIDVISSNNKIENVVDGLSLNLGSQLKNDDTITVAVTRDDSVAIKAVNDFVKSYNSLLDTIKKQTSFDVENQTSSALTGDSLVRRVESQMRSALNSAVGDGDIRTLGDLGIKTDFKTGKLEIDDDKLSKAVSENLGSVTAFLSGENGLGKQIDKTANEYLKSGGFISNATDSINQNIKMLKTQYETMSERIDNKMESYRRQFNQLDVLVNQMNGTSNYLTQQLDMLANMNKPKK